MDKSFLPYLHNGKRFHTLPDGQCLYRYPKGDDLKILMVLKKSQRRLFELAKRNYKTP